MKPIAIFAPVCTIVVGLSALWAPADAPRPPASEHPSARVATFRIAHSLTVKEIPAGSRKVRIWFWMPDDDDCQKVLDLSVLRAPAGYRLTRDADNGHRYFYAEVENPTGPVEIATEFRLRRQAVSVPVGPEKAGPLTDSHRAVLAEYLRRDVPNMQVDATMVERADSICGRETNVVRQARLLFDWVVDHTNHYSKPGAPKSSRIGSAEYCYANQGGACTDQHALFIALARARGIPTRLQFGTLLKPANEGKDLDPGYRCWVQYFVPNYGWVPMDISAANTNPALRDFYFSGLDERRVRFAEGRDLDLSPRQTGPRLNLLISAYVEADGKPHTSFQRVLRYVEEKQSVARP
jgi:transglutaminase-like putative cysteine protease